MPPTFLLQIVNLLKKGVKWLTVRPEKTDINFNTSDQNIRIDHLRARILPSTSIKRQRTMIQ